MTTTRALPIRCAAGMFAAAAATALVAGTPNVQSNVSTDAYNLTAFSDLGLDGVASLFGNTVDNARDIMNHFGEAPFAAGQQLIANQIGYLGGFFSNPLSLWHIPEAVFNNFNAAVYGAITPFYPVNDALYASLDDSPAGLVIRSDLWDHTLPTNEIFSTTMAGHVGFMQLIGGEGYPLDQEAMDILNSTWNDSVLVDQFEKVYPGVVNTEVDPYLFNALNMVFTNGTERNMAETWLTMSASPLSGVLFGALSTAVSPYLQVGAEIDSLFTSVFEGDILGALLGLINAPANVIDAYLNGFGELDLSGLIGGDLNPSIAIGGLLSSSGSMFDAFGMNGIIGDCGIVCAEVDLDGVGVGPIAAMIQLSQSIASAIGWSEFGNPLDVAFDGPF